MKKENKVYKLNSNKYKTPNLNLNKFKSLNKRKIIKKKIKMNQKYINLRMIYYPTLKNLKNNTRKKILNKKLVLLN